MKKQVLYSIIFLILLNYKIEAQTDLLLSKVSYELDFRFRAEQDWSSKKSDGNLREDRTRLRYRLRTGATFKNEWYFFSFSKLFESIDFFFCSIYKARSYKTLICFSIVKEVSFASEKSLFTL